jgi:hypothetical protein
MNIALISALKLISVGNSVGVIRPEELLAAGAECLFAKERAAAAKIGLFIKNFFD